jgi:hypothetical protein
LTKNNKNQFHTQKKTSDDLSSDPHSSGSSGNSDSVNGQTKPKDVPLGPACFVVFIFGLVILCVAVAIMSFLLTGKQGGRAAYAVREQLIPWVDQSELSQTDQVAIIEDLTALASQMEQDKLTSRQLTRLGVRLSDSPILQWGVVEEINRRAQASKGLTEQEKTDFERVCDRWLRAAGEGKLSMNEMEFTLQTTARKDGRSGRLTLKDEVDDDQLREVYRRILAICEKYKIALEPYEKSVSQVFKLMIEDGLAEK